MSFRRFALAAPAVVLLVLRHPRVLRRTGAVVLAGGLLVLAFEDAVHSVHHLPDHDQASQCAVAALSTNALATPGEPILVGQPVLLATAATVQPHPSVPDLDGPRPNRGRAPPPFLS